MGKESAEARTMPMSAPTLSSSGIVHPEPRVVVKRGPRAVKTKTFDDHFAELSAAYRAMTADERTRAIQAVQALYPSAATALPVASFGS
jgi:hypothetical protein